MTYKELKSELAQKSKRMCVYESLHECGISYSNVHHYQSPEITSNYSMGEVVLVYCNDDLIERIDNCREYSNSCKWRANHGKIVVRFTKKALKEYIRILSVLGNTLTMSVIKDYNDRKLELLEKHIVWDESKYNRKITIQ